MPLTEWTTEQLKREIKRREELELEKPQMIENPDLTSLKREAQEIVDSILNGTYHEDNDNAQYLYENVMITLFGPNIFKWINKNT